MENIELLLTDTKVVKALAHPLRAKLLTILDRREASPSQLSAELGEPLGTVSYHVRTLHDLGLLRLVDEKRQRGAVEHYYTAVKWVIHEDAWKALPGSLKQTVHASFLSRIGDVVSSAVVAGGFNEPYALLNHDTLALDQEGARELAREVSALMRRALAIESESKERHRRSQSAGARQEAVKVNLVLMLFRAPDDTGKDRQKAAAEDPQSQR
jgi:DNA-binding transcriptional ArsR family regulator